MLYAQSAIGCCFSLASTGVSGLPYKVPGSIYPAYSCKSQTFDACSTAQDGFSSPIRVVDPTEVTGVYTAVQLYDYDYTPTVAWTRVLTE